MKPPDCLDDCYGHAGDYVLNGSYLVIQVYQVKKIK